MSSLPECIQQLGCTDPAERAYAAEDIGFLNTADGVPPLLKRLHEEPSLAVRDAIFQALIRIDGDEAIEGSIRLLGSDDSQIRNQAVDVLRRKGARSIPFLSTAMRDGDKDIRKLVLDVLSEIHTGGAEEIYAAALSDEDPNVVITAVENLGRTRAGGFRTRIEALLLGGSHPMLIAACLEALVGIGHPSSLEIIRRRFPDLAKLPDFFLTPSLKAIASLGSTRDFNEVANLLTVRGPHLRAAILNTLIALNSRGPAPEPPEGLVPALRAVVEEGERALCRYQAVRVLGFWAARDDIYAFLLSCLSSPEHMVRLGAIETLRDAARPEFCDILDGRLRTETGC